MLGNQESRTGFPRRHFLLTLHPTHDLMSKIDCNLAIIFFTIFTIFFSLNFSFSEIESMNKRPASSTTHTLQHTAHKPKKQRLISTEASENKH